MNPAVTLTFLRLGKVAARDAVFYIIFQCIGGALGVLLMVGLLHDAVSDKTVNYVITAPGAFGSAAAFAAEILISFVMMMTVLLVSNHKTLADFTGLFAGALVMLYITFEAPVSGMSMNPARSFGSAIVAQQWTAFWIYIVAPVLGMLAASDVYVRMLGAHRVACAKLHHRNRHRCIFCEYQHPQTVMAPACVTPVAQEGN